MFKRIPWETKNEIAEKVKNGMTVNEAAKQYAVSTKTIYAWMSNQTRPEVSILEYNRFKTESADLSRFETLGEFIEYICSYLNYYNNDRIQIKLKMSPVQFKLKFAESVLEKRST